MKNIALVAHDGRKKEMIEWVKYNWKLLIQHNLYATGTTGKLIENIMIGEPAKIETIHDGGIEVDYDYTDVIFPFKNKITCLLSGPLGGDAQISAMIAEGRIDCIIFFCDTLIMQGHNADIQGLSRIADTYNIMFAPNRTTADMIITSPLFDNPDYHRIIPESINKYKNRQL